MFKQIMNTLKILCLLLALKPYLAEAAGDSKRPPHGGGKPPKEAFEACEGKSQEASVEIITPHEKLKAICKSIGGQLIAIPEGGIPHLPKEAYEDCKGKNEGEVLEVSTPEGKQSATCISINGQLAAIIIGNKPSK